MDDKLKSRRTLGQAIATRATDPLFYATLEVLPNPDRVLRKLGKSHEVFDDLVGDAHIIGELRAIRAALLGFEWRVTPGGDDPASVQAFELCSKRMNESPSRDMQWSDIIWGMGNAVFRGYSVSEIVWKRHDRYLMPETVIERPQRRFVFGSAENELRLLTRKAMTEGEPLGDRKWLLSRHMHSHDNPYGVAVFSACFWPYVFKHSGFKYFAKFCERYGFPWPIGKYPPGTPPEQQNELADALARMVEDGVAAIPSDGSVELHNLNTSGEIVHERLIHVCDSQLSKALTSQTLTTEIQGHGSRAASQTHREKEVAVNQCDRAIIEDTISTMFRWITELNFTGATPPRFEFYEEAEANTEMAKFITEARKHVPLSQIEVYERLQMSPPQDENDTIPVSSGQSGRPTPDESQFQHGSSCRHHLFQSPDDSSSELTEQVEEFNDEALAPMIEPIRALLDEVDSLEEFQRRFDEVYEGMDDSAMANLMKQALLTSYLHGMDDDGDSN